MVKLDEGWTNNPDWLRQIKAKAHSAESIGVFNGISSKDMEVSTSS